MERFDLPIKEAAWLVTHATTSAAPARGRLASTSHVRQSQTIETLCRDCTLSRSSTYHHIT
ncbi:hypothetical protein BD414DRAFT_64016 [Trametes punicea]|nr:hypothetical protein BD414DRAFT_64016 [Trametes punicea]